MKKQVKTAIIGAVAMFGIVTAGPAAAGHDHFVTTPGTCVEDIARGQTSKELGEGGYHKFHENVHLGTPGTQAFDNPNNPVDVHKVVNGEGCPA